MIDSFILPAPFSQKYFEKKNSLQIKFRKTLDSSKQYITEIIYLYQNEIDKNLEELFMSIISDFDDAIAEMVKNYSISSKLIFIYMFYFCNLKRIEKVRNIVQEQLYPSVKNICSNFTNLKSKSLSKKSLFQGFFSEDQSIEIDIQKVKLIKPPDDYSIVLNEEQCEYYDKFVAVVNTIISLNNLIDDYPRFLESMKDIQNKQEELRNKKDEPQKNLKKLQNEKEELQNKSEKLEELQKENEELQNKSEKLQKENEELQNKSEELQKEKEELQNEKEELLNQNKDLQEQIERLAKERSNDDDEYYKNQIQEREEKMKRIEENTKEEVIVKQIQEIETLTSENNNLKRMIQSKNLDMLNDQHNIYIVDAGNNEKDRDKSRFCNIA